MSLCYFDCPAGASGDMILAALLDAGFPPARLREGLARLRLRGYALRVSRTRPNGVAARRLDVRQDGGAHDLRLLPGIRRLIERARFPGRIAARSLAVFERLAAAEGKIHGIAPEAVHFHEIGAVDTIVDVVGTCLALEYLGIERVEASPLPLGEGTVAFSHGTLPLPAPATLELLRGVPVYGAGVRAETVTPTGAAILATLADRFGPLPVMTVRRVGYGAGHREEPALPNLVRALIGEPATGAHAERAVVVEASVDDMVPQQFEHLMARLFAAGAQDVSLTPTLMKKTRPGTIVTVIGPTHALSAIAGTLFAESTTIGLRHWEVGRLVLARENVTVRTSYGTIAVKVARLDSRIVNVAPEYEDCRRAAEARKVPLKVVHAAALRAAAAKGLVARG